MKIKSFLITALIVVSAVVSSVANNEPGNIGFTVLPVKGSEIFKVIYKAETVSRVKINLYNAQRQLIFSETIASNGFIRPLNFRGLEFGEYTIELVDGKGKRVEKVNFERSPVSKYFHVSKLATAENKFLLAIVNKNEDEKINVRIYDALNNLVHEEVKEISGNFAQIYNIKSTSGSVTFEVSDASGNSKTVSF